jgi:hypothetical protein
MRRFLSVAAAVVLFVVFAPAAADAKSVPAAQWAPKFCAALSTFQQHLAKDSKRAGAVLSGNIKSLNAAKSTLAGFMAKAVNDADAAISALTRAGAPHAANGSKIAARFVQSFQSARRLYVSARTEAQHLPTKTLARFESSTKQLTGALNKGADSLTESFTSIESLDSSKTVGAAQRTEPTCAFLQNN